MAALLALLIACMVCCGDAAPTNVGVSGTYSVPPRTAFVLVGAANDMISDDLTTFQRNVVDGFGASRSA